MRCDLFYVRDEKGDRTALSALLNSLRLTWKMDFGATALLWITHHEKRTAGAIPIPAHRDF